MLAKIGLSNQTIISPTADVFITVPEVDSYTQKWSEFVQTLGAALDMSESIHLGEAAVVMRQAPQKLRMVLENRSANIIGDLFLFLVVATPRRPGITDKEIQVFLSIVKSLLNFGATIVPTGHPVHALLRSLARWETEDLEHFSRNNSAACYTIRQFFPPNSPGYTILYKEVEATRWVGFTAASSEWDGTRIKNTLFEFPR